MKSLLLREWNRPVGLLLLTVALGGCASKPAAPTLPPAVPAAPAPIAAPVPLWEQHRVELGGGIRVDYQIQRRISSANKVSCYAFITGTLINASSQTLSRRTALDFNVFSDGKQLFRDQAPLTSDVAPGGTAEFEMVVSPVHKDGCVRYAPIVVTLRQVLVNRAP